MLEVLNQPATDLVSLATAKAHLGIEDADTTQDATVTALIDRASASINSFIGGSPLAGEYRETLQTQHGLSTLLLSRLPVTSVTSITLNGETLDPATYCVERETGLLLRSDNGLCRAWESSSVVIVRYQAGYATAPADLQHAALTLIASDFAARGRDPGLKSIGIGSINLAYFTPDAAPTIASVAHLLDPYRSIRIG